MKDEDFSFTAKALPPTLAVSTLTMVSASLSVPFSTEARPNTSAAGGKVSFASKSRTSYARVTG